MTSENTTEPTVDAPAEAEAPRRRSRRATSATTAPRATTPAAETQPGATSGEEGTASDGADAPAAEAAAAPAAEAAAAPVTAKRTRAPRRRTTSAESAAATPGESSAEAEPSAETPATADVTEAAAPARRSRSRRASATTTTPAAAPEAEADAAPAAQDAVVEPAADEAAPRRRRGRATKTASAPEPQPVADVVVDEPEDTEEPEAGTTAAAGLDVLAELGGRPPAPEPSPGESAPRLAATALLFQAPDPAARSRRRRAQAPAGPPRHPDEQAAEVAEDEAVEAEPFEGAPFEGAPLEGAPVEDVQREGADEEQDETSDEDRDEAEGAPRRRRRRGGRGRRSRGGADRGESETGTEDADEADGEDEDTEADEAAGTSTRGRRRRRGRGAAADVAEAGEGEEPEAEADAEVDDDEDEDASGEEGGTSTSRRRRRRRRSRGEQQPEETTRSRQRAPRPASDEVTALKGSTRLEAKRQRRREGRDAGRRRAVITEAEFLARREAVARSMVVRESDGRVQIAVLEDGVLVEHFVSRSAQNAQGSMSGNVYLGRVQNVLPSMEAAFVDVGKGRNAVLYAGEVNWDAAGLEGQPRRIEQALKSGDSVLVQVTKDPIGHKGARLTSQITLAGRYLVYVPGGGMTGISRKLPENERARLKKLLKEIVPDAAGVIVRTAAEGASDEELRRDVQRLQEQWTAIEKKAKTASAPALLQGEPDLAIRVVRDIFNDDFSSLVVQGDGAWSTISDYVHAMAPDLADRVSRWTGSGDVFAEHRIDEQLAKGMDRKVWLPSGGSLVIDRTEAMTVIDVNTGKFTGSGGTLEETVTRNNLEAAEEIVRQLRLRDIGGIIVIDFIDMVLESNRDLVLRRLVECLGRDRTKHQVAEVTSLGLVQMTRKRVGQGLVEAFSETCEHCNGRGFLVRSEPVEPRSGGEQQSGGDGGGDSKRSSRRKKAAPTTSTAAPVAVPVLPEAREAVKATLATIAAAAAHAHEHPHEPPLEPVMTEEGLTLVVAGSEVVVPPPSVDAPGDLAEDATEDATEDLTEVPEAPEEHPSEGSGDVLDEPAPDATPEAAEERSDA